MPRMTTWLLALTVVTGSSPALAQDAAAAAPDRPRVELGAGVGRYFSGGTMPYDTGTIDARVGVTLSRSWSVEGLLHIMPESSADIAGYYRVQAVWRVGRQGSLQPFVAFGGAGEFSRYSWSEHRFTDSQTGEPRAIPAGSEFHIEAPWYPTASIGVEKVVASRLAIRLDLTVGFGINDYGVAAAFLPAASVSIPLGRYRVPLHRAAGAGCTQGGIIRHAQPGGSRPPRAAPRTCSRRRRARRFSRQRHGRG